MLNCILAYLMAFLLFLVPCWQYYDKKKLNKIIKYIFIELFIEFLCYNYYIFFLFQFILYFYHLPFSLNARFSHLIYLKKKLQGCTSKGGIKVDIFSNLAPSHCGRVRAHPMCYVHL